MKNLRRLLEHDESLVGKTAGDCMKRSPKTIPAEELAPAALRTMEENRITSLFVCDADGRPVGIVHLHDLWGLELI